MFRSYEAADVEQIRAILLSEICDQCDSIPLEDLRNILRYLKHRELQFAFEHFMVVVIERTLIFSSFDRAKLIDVAKFVGTDKNSIQEPYLYDKIINYANTDDHFFTVEG